MLDFGYLAVVGFVVYVLGFVVLYLSTFELGAVALAVLIRRTTVYEPWQNPEWRKLASTFLGPELSPPIEDIPLEPPREEPSATNVEKLSAAIKNNFARAMAPHHLQVRWQKWYDVLRLYFPAPQNAQLAFGTFYFSVLNSIGLAGSYQLASLSGMLVGWCGSCVSSPSLSLTSPSSPAFRNSKTQILPAINLRLQS